MQWRIRHEWEDPAVSGREAMHAPLCGIGGMAGDEVRQLALGGDTGWTRNVHPEYLLGPGAYRWGGTLNAVRQTASAADGSRRDLL